jgi:hypothetical protein
MMRAYVITTGSVFGLLTLAHVGRAFVEPHLAKDPWFILLTLLSLALCLWAWRVIKRA